MSRLTKFRIQKCVEPDDRNYGGWDLLVLCPDGTYSCVGEARNWDKVMDVLNDPKNPSRSLLRRTVDIILGGIQGEAQ